MVNPTWRLHSFTTFRFFVAPYVEPLHFGFGLYILRWSLLSLHFIFHNSSSSSDVDSFNKDQAERGWLLDPYYVGIRGQTVVFCSIAPTSDEKIREEHSTLPEDKRGAKGSTELQKNMGRATQSLSPS